MNRDMLRMILAIMLSVAIFALWDKFFPYHEHANNISSAVGLNDEMSVHSSVHSNGDGIKRDANKYRHKINNHNSISHIDKTFSPKTKGIEKTLTLENSNTLIKVSTVGALITSVTLKRYYNDANNHEHMVELIDNNKKIVDTFFSLSNNTDVFASCILPELTSIWKVALQTKKLVRLIFDNGQNIKFIRDIELNDDYLVTVYDKVINNTTQDITLLHNIYLQREGDYQNVQSAIVHEGMIGFAEDRLKEYSYSSIVNDGLQTFKEGKHDWLGITDRYWLSAIIPGKQQIYTPSFNVNKVPGSDEYIFKAAYNNSEFKIDVGQEKIINSYFFIGPKEIDLLDGYEKELDIKSFDKAVDFGLLYPITKPIFYFLNILFNIFGSMAWALLMFTLIFKLLMLPLALKSSRAMSKMKKLKPEMDLLQLRFKDDKQKLNVELMALYKKEGVNPAAGCLPLLLQIPIMFALYKVLNISIHMHHAPFWGWVSDLSAPEAFGCLTLFGFIEWQIPAMLSFLNIGLWPILMGLTAYIQHKVQPQSGGIDPTQQKMMAFMPLMMVFLMANFPVGVIIYWSLSNLLGIIQQYVIDYLDKK